MAALVLPVRVFRLFPLAIPHRLAPSPLRLQVVWAVLTPCRTQADLTLRVPGPMWKCRNSIGYVMASMRFIMIMMVTEAIGIC